MIIMIVLPLRVPISIIMLVQTPLSLSSCSLATTPGVRSTMVVATATIGVLRRSPVLLTPAACTSVVASSIQPMTSVGASGLASGAYFRISVNL